MYAVIVYDAALSRAMGEMVEPEFCMIRPHNSVRLFDTLLDAQQHADFMTAKYPAFIYSVVHFVTGLRIQHGVACS